MLTVVINTTATSSQSLGSLWSLSTIVLAHSFLNSCGEDLILEPQYLLQSTWTDIQRCIPTSIRRARATFPSHMAGSASAPEPAFSLLLLWADCSSRFSGESHACEEKAEPSCLLPPFLVLTPTIPLWTHLNSTRPSFSLWLLWSPHWQCNGWSSMSSYFGVAGVVAILLNSCFCLLLFLPWLSGNHNDSPFLAVAWPLLRVFFPLSPSLNIPSTCSLPTHVYFPVLTQPQTLNSHHKLGTHTFVSPRHFPWILETLHSLLSTFACLSLSNLDLTHPTPKQCFSLRSTFPEAFPFQ